MGMRFRNLVSVLVLAAASTAVLASETLADTPRSNAESFGFGYENLSETFNRAFTENSGTYFQNRTLGRQVDLIFGIGGIDNTSFPEREIDRDAELIYVLYQDALYQQSSSDPIIRTPDLPNPYSSSILQSPSSFLGGRVGGSELVFEELPLR